MLRAAYSCLAPGGVIVIADETIPEGGLSRVAYQLRRLTAAAVTYLFTQATTHRVRDLAQQVRAAKRHGEAR